MSGAVDTTKNYLQVAAAPIYAAPKAAFDLVTKGKNPIASVGGTVKGAAGAAMDLATPGLKEAGLVNNQPLPNIADPINPAAEAAKADAERKRVKRQAEIDLLTDKPGRGGTILTDQYSYKV